MRLVKEPLRTGHLVSSRTSICWRHMGLKWGMWSKRGLEQGIRMDGALTLKLTQEQLT